MAYQVTFTLNALYTGTTQATNFTIFGEHSGGSPVDYTIASGVTAAALTTGVTYTVPNTVTGGTVTSTGDCTNSVNWTGLTPSPTPTPTLDEGGGGETSLFKVSRCSDDSVFYLANDISCINGIANTPPTPQQYVVGQYVQFLNGTACPGGATYCGLITEVNATGVRNGVLSQHALLNQAKGCTNTECIE
tara:strand:- start:79 stop:648 length:570 start_codon:yes stop_codon:yes gene_type:complete